MNKKRKKREKIKKILKKMLYFLVNITILFLVFSLGSYLAVKNDVVRRFAEENVVFLGKVLGKYEYQNGKLAQNVNFDLYWEVWDTMKRLHVNSSDFSEKKMFYGSLEGLVNSVNDPYSQFMNPQNTKEFKDDMSGLFEGIGAEIGIREGALTVIAPLDGSPAQLAGLMAGDKIIKINNESAENISIDEAVKKIRGPKGTEVVLNVFRQELDDFKDIKIIRDVILIKSVKKEVLEDNIFLIEVNAFNNDTEGLFSEFARLTYENSAKGVIIDLRNNPGGYLQASTKVLGEWINGELALVEIFSDDRRVEYMASGGNYLKNIPTVVLINYGSASASEIVAGALQDYNLAKVVGEKSYGKGSVQMVKSLSDGSSIKITVAKWLSPLGQDISEHGITPDYEVFKSFEDYEQGIDPQLSKALELLK